MESILLELPSCRHPALTRYIYALLIIAIFAVPALITYYLSLDAVYHMKPE